jgi:heme-degrading monooxygenase HmoA
MFAVIFEVQPNPAQRDAYFGHAQALRPELERIDGFIDNLRYRSLSREGWLLSLSTWRDEKALVRWRTHAGHHLVQRKGRGGVLLDYHLRVGEVAADTQVPPGHFLRTQRLDETEVGAGTAVTLLDARLAPEWVRDARADDVAAALGLDLHAPGLAAWDAFDAVLAPGDAIVLATWRDADAARASPDAAAARRPGPRRREVRIVRDYGMFDRREAPQHHPEVRRPPHAGLAGEPDG